MKITIKDRELFQIKIERNLSKSLVQEINQQLEAAYHRGMQDQYIKSAKDLDLTIKAINKK